MRQRKIKGLTEQYLKDNDVVTEIKLLTLPKDMLIHLEIGCGKGQFITDLAKDNSNIYYIAFEMNKDVIYRVLEKKIEHILDNLLLVLGDASNLLDYFKKESIDLIYLNFSDPWPKARHHKRRLTYHPFLLKYREIMKVNTYLELRTDHKVFFDDSIVYFQDVFFVEKITYDLLPSQYMTEYEEKKRRNGPIYQIIGRKIT